MSGGVGFRRRHGLAPPQIDLPQILAKIDGFHGRLVVPNGHDRFAVADEDVVGAAIGKRQLAKILSAGDCGRGRMPREKELAGRAILLHQTAIGGKGPGKKDGIRARDLSRKHSRGQIVGASDQRVFRFRKGIECNPALRGTRGPLPPATITSKGL